MEQAVPVRTSMRLPANKGRFACLRPRLDPVMSLQNGTIWYEKGVGVKIGRLAINNLRQPKRHGRTKITSRTAKNAYEREIAAANASHMDASL